MSLAPPASRRALSALALAALLGACGRLGFESATGAVLDTDDVDVRADAGPPGSAPNEPSPPPGDGAQDTPDAGTPDPGDGSPSDAGTPPTADAGTPRDAGTPPDPDPEDAGTPPPPPPPPPPSCDVVSYAGLCWVLSGSTESCDDACRPHGGSDPRAAGVIGSPAQGGSIDHCHALLSLFGFPGAVTQGHRLDGAGLGCHRWDDGVLWWLDDPGYDSSSSSGSAIRICGCQR